MYLRQGGITMDGYDITALSTSLSTQSLLSDVSIAICRLAKDTMETNSDGLRKILEQSVCPEVGQNIDVLV